MKVAIFTEDRYGIGFLKKVIERLKREKYIQSFEYVKAYMPAQIEKCHNVKKIKSVLKEADRIVVVIDKENEREYDEEDQIWKHLKELKEEDRRKIAIIATEPCIEEWICISLGLDFDKTGMDAERKSDKVLERYQEYKKFELPNFVSKLNFEKLKEKSASFSKFLESLT